jgi:hypothetical protein
MSADTSALQVIRRVSRERWIHQGRHPGFVAFEEAVEAVRLREVTRELGARGSRHWTAELRGIDADITLDSLGRIWSMRVRPQGIHYLAGGDVWDVRRWRIRRLQGDTKTLRLPSSRFRELWIPLPPGPPTSGVTWTDTLSFRAEPGEGLEESYHAVRRHRVLGDTVIDGQVLPWIRTEADVRYELSELDVLLRRTRRIEREVSGRTVGTMVVDPATGLRVVGADTASWDGRAVLHDSVAGALESGVRYERVRTWAQYDSAGYEVLRDSLRIARDRRDTGMLIMPRERAEERLAAGDSALADSLITRWRKSRNPEEAREIQRALRFFGRGVGWARQHLDSLALTFALERGDTAQALAVARGHLPWHNRLTLEEAELVLPYLDRPERLWALGVPERFDYQELTGTLLQATPLIEPDSARWGCDPRACALFLDRLETAEDPRVRDAALVGAFARDPARWYDSLLARQAGGARLVDRAVRLARGAPREGVPPVPEADAGWEAWREWWDGGRRGDHRAALRVYTARTGRDPVAELAARWPPEDDSARVVLGEILRALDAIPERTAEELRAEILSGEEGRIRRAQRELGLVHSRGDDVDPEVVADLLAPLVDSILARGDAPWPLVPGLPRGEGPILHSPATSSHGIRGLSTFLLTENLPAAVLENLLEGVTSMATGEWESRDRRLGGHAFRFFPVKRWGSFLQVTWDWTVYEPRTPDEAPRGYAGGGHLQLLDTGEGWVVVGRGSWIT